jgi:Nif-specific ferredoxin III
MAFISFTTRDGTPWTPEYLTGIDADLCIGCGRCFKVCTQDVMKLVGVDEHGNFCNPFDDDEGDLERKIMVIDKAGNCIGCTACSRVCGSKAQTHEPLAA